MFGHKMRPGAKWKLIFQTITMAFLSPGANAGNHAGISISSQTAQGDAGPRRAFLLAFGHPVVDEALARRVRAAQIAAIARLTPFSILANIVSAIAVTPVFLQFLPVPYMVAWLTAIGGLLAYTSFRWFKARQVSIETASRKSLSRAVRHATMLSTLWSVLPLTAFAVGDPMGIWIASAVTTAMICGGAFALATVPQAAFRWVAILYIASVTALAIHASPSGWPLFFLLTSYTVVVIGSVTSTAWLFASHFLAEAALDQRGELIALLMNEFEEKDSDWTWETDSKGNLQNVSDRFLHASGRTRLELHAMRMIDLAYSLDASDARTAVAELETMTSRREAFRDIVIGVDVNGEARWWSLAARPAFDERGSFTGYRGVASDVTEPRRASALVTHLAEHDSLTGIGNRSWFLKQAEMLLEKQRLAGRSALTLFLIDLDNFKVVNDTSGHPAGDELLKQVASRFSQVGDGRTALARFGGDEFAALGQFASEEAAGAFAQDLIRLARKPFRIGRRDFVVGATVGFARFRDREDTVDDLLRKADIALYKAKEAGRGRALAFECEMEREVRERRELEADLREACENGGLSVDFQPIIDSRTGKVVSSEVLLRWLHPVRGEIPPATFLPIAEHAGLILPLGSWVLRKACAAAAQCPELESVAVNLSPVQFMDPNLVDLILCVLDETGFPPERLVLEITEAVFTRDFGAAAGKLEKLRDLGITIALDDFGTGYSSLSYLRRFRFDKIKIDKSFVGEIGERSDSLAIISAIIALAHNLGLEVTAEGVERQFQVDALRTLGCDTLQGYYFGRPDANPMKVVRIKKEDWNDRVPSTAPRRPATIKSAS